MVNLKNILDFHYISSFSGDLNIPVSGLEYDSRRVRKGFLFFAIPGTVTRGEKFIPQAIENGAIAVVVPENSSYFSEKVPVIRTPHIRKLMARAAKNFYNNVDKEMKIIGITGTNGKTTTSFLLYDLFRHNHLKPSLIGTIEYRLGNKILPATHTTPESVDLFNLFTEAFIADSKIVVMEVSSHALDQDRVFGIDFDFGIFTNLSHDHLDYHKTMENYFEAKKKLFQNQKKSFKAIINLDDPYGEILVKQTPYEIYTYSYSQSKATVSVKSADYKLEGTFLELNTPMGELHVISPLIGKFNVYNILATITLGIAFGFPFENISSAIQNLPQVPGRCEKILLPSRAVAVIDYAHTPDALKNICETLYTLTQRRLIIVFGCGGDRDKGKRPVMGKIAEKYGDIVFITSDNPRSEDPAAIIEEIYQGITEKNKCITEIDRSKAIHKALDMAHGGDIVLIAGKGHENYQEIKGEKFPFNDKEEVQKWIKSYRL